jgi:hypothetical protein
MSLTARDQSLAVGLKWSGFLKQVFPNGGRVKAIAQFFGTAEATAKRWLQGYPPNAEVYHRAEQTWGPSFIAWMHRGYDWAEHLSLMVEEEALEKHIESVRQRLRVVEGGLGNRRQENRQSVSPAGVVDRAKVRRA